MQETTVTSLPPIDPEIGKALEAVIDESLMTAGDVTEIFDSDHLVTTIQAIIERAGLPTSPPAELRRSQRVAIYAISRYFQNQQLL